MKLELTAARLRHAAHYLKLLMRLDRLYKDGVEGMGQASSELMEDLPQVLHAQEEVTKLAAEMARAARLCSDYADIGAHLIAAHLTLGHRRRWREAALQASRRLRDRAAEAAHLVCLGNLQDEAGDHTEALASYRRALELRTGLGDDEGMGKAMREAAIACLNSGDPQGALELLEVFPEAVVVSDRLPTLGRDVTGVDDVRGSAYLAIGDHQHAVHHLQVGLAQARAEQNPLIEFQVLLDLGRAHQSAGRCKEGINSLQLALEMAEAMGDRMRLGCAAHTLGLIQLSCEGSRDAIPYLERGARIFEELGHDRRLGRALTTLGMAQLAVVDAEAAVRTLEEGLRLLEDTADRTWLPIALESLADGYSRIGRPQDAIATHERLKSLQAGHRSGEER